MPVPRSLLAARRSIRHRLFWILATWSGVLLGTLSLCSYYMFRPLAYDGMGRLGFLSLLYPPLLVAFFALAIVIGLLSWRRGHLRLAAMLGCAAVVAALAVVIPFVLVRSWAVQRDITLSYSDALIPMLHPSKPGPDRTVIYHTASPGLDLKMDLWIPPEGTDNTHGRPAIVRIHGGAWVRGSRGELPEWNRWLQELGYVVFDVDYRMPPEAGWQGEVGDVKCAIGWIVAHAEELGIDKGRIYAMGNSAGGNLAMLAAYGMADANLPPSCSLPAAKIRGVINLYGPTDLSYTYAETGSPRFIQPALQRYVGGSVAAHQDRYRILSPVTYALTGVPTLTVFGTQDRIIPAEQALKFGLAMDAAGIANEVIAIPATDHAFDVNWNGLATQIARTKVKSFLERQR